MATVLNIGLQVDDANLRAVVQKRVDKAKGVKLAKDSSVRMDVIVADMGEDPTDRIRRIGAMLSRGSAAEAVLLGAEPAPELLILAMRAGIKEFAALPLREGDLEAAWDRIRSRAVDVEKSGSGPGEIVSVVGAAGGLGATSLAVNLAWELEARRPGSTVLVDLRRPDGEVPLFLDLEYSYTWGEVAENISRMDQTFLRSVLAEAENGLRILPAPSFSQESKPFVTPEAMRECLKGLADMFSYVVVEDNGGLDPVSQEVLSVSKVQWLVMAMSVTCLAKVKRHLEDAARLDASFPERIRLAAARVVKGGDIGPEEAAEVLGKQVSCTIPEDLRGTMAAINQGRPLALSAPKSPMLKAVREMAREFAKENRASGKKSSLFGLFRRSGAGESDLAHQPA
jgi:pilus assembly protein CpaE